MAKRKAKVTTDSPVVYRRVAIDDLHEDPANARIHPDENLADIRASLKEFGQVEPLVTGKNGKVIGGNGRLKVMRELGWPEVDIAEVDVNDMKATALGIALNRAGERAEWDREALDKLLKEVEATEPDFAQALDELAQAEGLNVVEPGAGGDEFDATPADGPTRANVGDLWAIRGNGIEHRVVCGDCTVAENVERLMGGEKVGLCFTSPPYAQQRDYGEAAKEKVQDWYALMCGAFAHLPMTDDGQVLVNLGLIHREGEWVPYWQEWIEWMRTQGWRRFGWYVWDQLSGFPGVFGGRCAPSFEFIFHFNHQPTVAQKTMPTKSEGTTRHGGRMGPDGWETDHHIERINTTGPVKIPDATWRINRQPDISIAHSAKFPVALPAMAIETWPADIYDPFFGSGATLIAAHRLGRKCYGCEIEPKYVDVILRRAEAEGLVCEKVG